MSMSSLDKDSQYAVLEPKWELPPGPDVLTAMSDKGTATPTRPRPQSFAQKLRSTGKSVKGRLGNKSTDCV